MGSECEVACYGRGRGRRVESWHRRDPERHYIGDWRAGLHLQNVRGMPGDPDHRRCSLHEKVQCLHSELEIVVGRNPLVRLEGKDHGRDRHHETACGPWGNGHVETGSRRDRGNVSPWLFCPGGQHRFFQKVAV